MEDRFKYFAQLGLLNELFRENEITKEEYDQIKNFMKQKYRIKEILV